MSYRETHKSKGFTFLKEMKPAQEFTFFPKKEVPKRSEGFTLIEILIVISIIAVLTTFVLSSLTQIQKNSRDQKRKGDLNTISSVLQRFYNDNGRFPAVSSGKIQYLDGNCISTGSTVTVTWGTDGIVCNGKSYLKVVPEDPFGSSRQAYWYESCGTYQNYTLGAKLENTNDKEVEVVTFPCSATSGYNYRVVPNK